MDDTRIVRDFPVELTERQQWLTWNLSGDGKKIPNGKSNDPKTWVQYSDIQEFEKVAYVFTKDDPFVGIDLDDCIDEHGSYNEVAEFCLSLFRGLAYIERSYSKRGLHFILKGKKPDWAVCKRGNVECYDHSRFWIMTGDTLEPCLHIEESQESLEKFLGVYLSKKKDQRIPSAAKVNRQDTQSALAQRMLDYADNTPAARQGDRNAKGFNLAGHLWSFQDGALQGPTETDVLCCLQHWNQKNDPPMHDDEVASIARSAKINGTPRASKPPSTSSNRSRSLVQHDPELGEDYQCNFDEETENWIEDATFQTDNELGVRFIDRHSQDLRFAPAWKRWLSWDGKRWRIDENSSRAIDLGRRFSSSLWDHFSDSMKKQIDSYDKETDRTYKFLRNANKGSGINAYINLASADPRVRVDVAELNPNPYLLNLQNGTFDLGLGKFREHRQNDSITQLASVGFDPHAKCELWKSTLQTIFDHDDEVIGFVQRLLGYSISGLQSEHVLPIAYGSGCNGKSTLTNTILAMLGDYGGLANEALLLGSKDAHPTEKAFLYQKRFVAISEPEQGARLRESRVKELTGDGTITARRMHEDFWSFERTHTFWMSTNHLPRITGSDEGIWRRVKLIPFTVDLRLVTTPVPDLDKRLVADEGPGILNWLIQGFLDWQAYGLQEPEKVKAAVSSYKSEEDELELFIAERCTVGGGQMVEAERIFNAYQTWGGKMSRSLFGRKLGDKFVKDKPSSGDFRKKTLYHGIDLSNENTVAPSCHQSSGSFFETRISH
jgi:putative DNA primase/helicase